MLRPPIVYLNMIYTASPMCKVSLVHHPHAHARCETRSLQKVMIRTLSALPGSTACAQPAGALCAELGVVQLSPWPAVCTMREN